MQAFRSSSFVYALREVGSEGFRYVGKTMRGRTRLLEHRKGTGKSHCCNWIKSVASAGGEIEMVPLEYADPDNLCELERKWVSALRAAGHRLTNLTDGGQGAHGRKLSQSNKTAMLAAQRPHSAEVLHRMRLAQLGKKQSPETIERRANRLRGRKHSEEARSAMSVAKRGHDVSPATRARIADNLRGRKDSAETRALKSARARRGEANRTSKLDVPAVRDIRARGKAGERHRDIAAIHKVSQVLVSRIIRRLAWAHVD
jgi:hypothetical protein